MNSKERPVKCPTGVDRGAGFRPLWPEGPVPDSPGVNLAVLELGPPSPGAHATRSERHLQADFAKKPCPLTPLSLDL